MIYIYFNTFDLMVFNFVLLRAAAAHTDTHTQHTLNSILLSELKLFQKFLYIFHEKEIIMLSYDFDDDDDDDVSLLMSLCSHFISYRILIPQKLNNNNKKKNE